MRRRERRGQRRLGAERPRSRVLLQVTRGLAAPGAPSPKQVSRYLPPGVRRACAALSPSSVTGVTSCACSSGRVVGLSEDRGVEADKAARSGAGTGAGSTGTSVDLRRSRSNSSQRANAWETRRSDESTVNYSSGSNGFVISRSPVRLRRVALGCLLFPVVSAGAAKPRRRSRHRHRSRERLREHRELNTVRRLPAGERAQSPGLHRSSGTIRPIAHLNSPLGPSDHGGSIVTLSTKVGRASGSRATISTPAPFPGTGEPRARRGAGRWRRRVWSDDHESGRTSAKAGGS